MITLATNLLTQFQLNARRRPCESHYCLPTRGSLHFWDAFLIKGLKKGAKIFSGAFGILRTPMRVR